MCTFSSDGMDATARIYKKDLGVFDALDFGFKLGPGTQVEIGNALEFVFLGSHDGGSGRERSLKLVWDVGGAEQAADSQ